jgi:succinyl-diaminopimelate desuccinylase
VHAIAPFLDDLLKQQWDQGDDEFPASHCQVAWMNAGTGAGNVTPAYVDLLANFRNGPGSPSDEIKARVDELLLKHELHDYDIAWEIMGEPFRSKPGRLRKAVVDAVEEVLGVYPDLNTGGGTSDGRHIAPLGTEVLELGLLNTSIHQVDERTPVPDLDRLKDTYLDTLKRLMKG